MRPLRPTSISTAATAGAVGVIAALALAAGPAVVAGAAAASEPNAQSEYQAAMKAIGTQGVHFSSTATQNGVTIAVQGDTGSTAGAQKLVVKNGNLTERLSALLVGSTGYINGNATALHHVIGLTSGQSSKYAGTWLSFPTSNSGLDELVSGLLNSQVSSELQMSGPYRYSTATTVNGKPALAIHGSQGTQSGGKVAVVLYVPATGRPLPMKEVTNPDSQGGKSSIQGTVAFSAWGEKTSEKAPGHSVSLLKLVPGSTSSGTSTTAG
jgi:hypothetical protein